MSTTPSHPRWDVPDDAYDAALEAIRAHFGHSWLEASPPTHPVQKLAQSVTMQSRVQLYWLGQSLRTLEHTDAAWLRHQVTQAKSINDSNRVGAVFEILGLAMFVNSQHRLQPSPRNTPGYDGLIDFDSGHRILLSLKSFGSSRYHREIQKRGNALVRALLSRASELGLHWIGLAIEAKEYPGSELWLILERELCRNLYHATASQLAVSEIGPWRVIWNVAPSNLSTRMTSSQIIIAVPHHLAERQSHFSKLEREATRVQSKIRDIRANGAVILVRVDDSIYAPLLNEWAEDYLSRHPAGPIDELFFYQPSVVINAERTSLHHYIATQSRAGLERPRINLNVPVGIVTSTPTCMSLSSPGGTPLPLTNFYLYQSGDIYVRASLHEDLGREFSFGVQAHNLRMHIAIEDGDAVGVLSSTDIGSNEISLLN